MKRRDFIFAIIGSFMLTGVITENNTILNTCRAATYNRNSDGYVYKGRILLTRVISGQKETFYLFKKFTTEYVAKSKKGPYYKLNRYLTIDQIDYKY